MIFLNLDENNYLLSIATVGGGVEVNIDLSEYDLSGDRILAHKWENGTLVFDEERYKEIEEEAREDLPNDDDKEPTAEEKLNALVGGMSYE